MNKFKIRITEEVNNLVIPFMFVFPNKASFEEWRTDYASGLIYQAPITAKPGDIFEVNEIINCYDNSFQPTGTIAVREYDTVLHKVTKYGAIRYYYAWAIESTFYEIV